eukprot:1006869-Prorocentrum_minimum.AAC.2
MALESPYVYIPTPALQCGRAYPTVIIQSSSTPAPVGATRGTPSTPSRCYTQVPRTGLGFFQGTSTLHTELAPGSPGCSQRWQHPLDVPYNTP